MMIMLLIPIVLVIGPQYPCENSGNVDILIPTSLDNNNNNSNNTMIITITITVTMMNIKGNDYNKIIILSNNE